MGAMIVRGSVIHVLLCQVARRTIASSSHLTSHLTSHCTKYTKCTIHDTRYIALCAPCFVGTGGCFVVVVCVVVVVIVVIVVVVACSYTMCRACCFVNSLVMERMEASRRQVPLRAWSRPAVVDNRSAVSEALCTCFIFLLNMLCLSRSSE